MRNVIKHQRAAYKVPRWAGGHIAKSCIDQAMQIGCSGTAQLLRCLFCCFSSSCYVAGSVLSAGHTLVGKMGKQRIDQKAESEKVVRRRQGRVSARHRSLARQVWRGQGKAVCTY